MAAPKKNTQEKRRIYQEEPDSKIIQNLKEKVKELEIENDALREQLQTPIPIDMVFDLLPEADAVNLVSRLQNKLHSKIKARIEMLRNETGLSENRLEIFELNLRNASLGRIFKR